MTRARSPRSNGHPDRAGLAPRFSPEQLAEVRRLQALYPDKRGALLPVLHMAQDTFGYDLARGRGVRGRLFELSPAHVHEVVTFYTLFFQQPKGRHVVAVCHNLSCYLAGARTSWPTSKRASAIEVGETTPTTGGHAAVGGVPVRVRGRADGAGGRPLRAEPHAREGRPHSRGLR
jgi:NADH:ubiquinone oxidoreductase subunit E